MAQSTLSNLPLNVGNFSPPLSDSCSQPDSSKSLQAIFKAGCWSCINGKMSIYIILHLKINNNKVQIIECNVIYFVDAADLVP